MQVHGTKEHFNLYYLFSEDQAAHRMPADRAEHLRDLVLSTFAKRKTAQDVDPP